MSESGFGVYVHWPFCAAKCPYCDFNSHVRTKIDEGDWIAAIKQELKYVSSRLDDAGREVGSVFFGGGTPSLMSGHAAGEILAEIDRLWTLSAKVEITLEANPSSADAGRFHDYRRAGVNRLSIGVQALNDRDLKFLGRLHDCSEARDAVALATSVFDRVSIDLIYARPGQTVSSWRTELLEALAFGTEHLSLYQLTIEEGTPFAAQVRTGAICPLDSDLAADFYEATQDITNKSGLPAYEISNHARPGAECRHNLLYWRYGSYAGVGPGAHGRLDCGGSRVATMAERLPERWFSRVTDNGHGYIEMTPLAKEDAAHEQLLMNLRLAEGIDLGLFRERWGAEWDARRIGYLVSEGYLETNGTRAAATPKGRLVLNSLIVEMAASWQ